MEGNMFLNITLSFWTKPPPSPHDFRTVETGTTSDDRRDQSSTSLSSDDWALVANNNNNPIPSDVSSPSIENDDSLRNNHNNNSEAIVSFSLDNKTNDDQIKNITTIDNYATAGTTSTATATKTAAATTQSIDSRLIDSMNNVNNKLSIFRNDSEIVVNDTITVVRTNNHTTATTQGQAFSYYNHHHHHHHGQNENGTTTTTTTMISGHYSIVGPSHHKIDSQYVHLDHHDFPSIRSISHTSTINSNRSISINSNKNIDDHQRTLLDSWTSSVWSNNLNNSDNTTDTFETTMTTSSTISSNNNNNNNNRNESIDWRDLFFLNNNSNKTINKNISYLNDNGADDIMWMINNNKANCVGTVATSETFHDTATRCLMFDNVSATLLNETSTNLTLLLSSSSSSSSPSSPVDFNSDIEPERVYWALILIILPILALFGNILVILSVYREKTLQTVTNWFIVSLALADLFVTIPMLFCTYVMVNVDWELSEIICDLYIAIDVVCSTASIFNLVAISFDRYIAVTHPIFYSKHKNDKRVIITIILVWMASFGVGLPIMLGANTSPERIPELCIFYNSDFIIYSSLWSFYVPCLIMVILYYKIFKAIHDRARKKMDNTSSSGAGNSKNRSNTLYTSCKPSANNNATNTNDNNSNGNNNNNNNSVNQTIIAQNKAKNILGIDSGTKNTTSGSGSNIINNNPKQKNNNRLLTLDNITINKKIQIRSSTTSSVIKLEQIKVPIIDDYNKNHIKHNNDNNDNNKPTIAMISQDPITASNDNSNNTESHIDEDDDEEEEEDENEEEEQEIIEIKQFNIRQQQQQSNNKCSNKFATSELQCSIDSNEDTDKTDQNEINSIIKSKLDQTLESESDQNKSVMQHNDVNSITNQQKIDQKTHQPQQHPQQQQQQQQYNSPRKEIQQQTSIVIETSSPSCSTSGTSKEKDNQDSSFNTIEGENEQESEQPQQTLATIATKMKNSNETRIVMKHNATTNPTISIDNIADITDSVDVEIDDGRLNVRNKNKIETPSPTCCSQYSSQSGSSKKKSRFNLGRKHKSSRKKREKVSARRERKATKTLAIVLGVFLLCWTPFFSCNILDAICIKLHENHFIQSDCRPGMTAFLLTTWLGYMNSCANPLIYTIFNTEFRKAFRKILCQR